MRDDTMLGVISFILALGIVFVFLFQVAHSWLIFKTILTGGSK